MADGDVDRPLSSDRIFEHCGCYWYFLRGAGSACCASAAEQFRAGGDRGLDVALGYRSVLARAADLAQVDAERLGVGFGCGRGCNFSSLLFGCLFGHG